MKILGLDLGYARLGYGLIEKKDTTWRAADYGLIATPATDPFPRRLIAIQKAVAAILRRHRPDLVAVERIFFFRNVTTAFYVGRAWGVIEYTIARADLPVVEFTPLQIKQFLTGYGQATKQQVQRMLVQVFALRETPKPDDVADALACALCATQRSHPSPAAPAKRPRPAARATRRVS